MGLDTYIGLAKRSSSTTVLNVRNEDIHFYSIPTRPLSDILKNASYQSFTLDISDSSMGKLTINTSQQGMLGVGGFKTAHDGWLTLVPPPVSGLGSLTRHKIVVKRPFHKVFAPGQSTGHYKIGRFALANEVPKLFREANVLYWAKSLLQFTYDFIDHCISSSSHQDCPHIPRVRFVEAGLEFAYDQGPQGLACAASTSSAGFNTGSTRAAFLLEELIAGEDVFQKFIHNMDANPLLDEHESGYDFALFLAFTQHVQYVKTGGLAIISDYQGMPTEFNIFGYVLIDFTLQAVQNY